MLLHNSPLAPLLRMIFRTHVIRKKRGGGGELSEKSKSASQINSNLEIELSADRGEVVSRIVRLYIS